MNLASTQKQKELWPSIVKSVADDNLKVATTAAAAVLTVAKEPHGLELTFSADSISLFNDMLAGCAMCFAHSVILI